MAWQNAGERIGARVTRRRRHSSSAERPRIKITPAQVETWCFVAYLGSLSIFALFFGGNRDWVWGTAAAVFSLISLAVVWVVPIEVRLRAVGIHKRRPWLALFVIAWLVFGAVQWFPTAWFSPGWSALSADPGASLKAWTKSLLYSQVMILALLLLDTHKRMKAALVALFVVALIHAISASVGHLVGASIRSPHWVFNPIGGSGTFVNRNHFAGYLELHLAIGVGLLVSGLRYHADPDQAWRQKVRDWLQIALSAKAQIRIALVLMVVALVLTQSRMGNVAFFAGLLLVATLAFATMQLRPRALPALIASILVIDLVVIGSWFGADKIAARIAVTRVEIPEAQAPAANTAVRELAPVDINIDRERPQLVRAALAQWRTAPRLGTGGGTFKTLFPLHRPTDMSASYYEHAHNDYAQFLAEYGLLGSLLLAGLVASACAGAVHALRNRRDKLLLGCAFGSLVGISALLIHAFSDFNLQIPANTAMFAFLLAVAWLAGFGLRAEVKRSAKNPVRTVALAAFILASCNAFAEPMCELGRPDYDASVPRPDALKVQVSELKNAIKREPGRADVLRSELLKVAFSTAEAALRLDALDKTAESARYWRFLDVELADTQWRMSSPQGHLGDQNLAWLALERKLHKLEPSEQGALCDAFLKLSGEPKIAGLAYRVANCLQKTNPVRALALVQVAADLDHPGAQEVIGKLCAQQGEAGRTCAIKWLCKAADSGRASAAGLAGWLITQQRPSPGLAVKTAALYEMSIASGDAASANNLGELYEQGWIGDADAVQAELWYLKAAQANIPEAQLNLARLLQKRGERAQADAWLLKAEVALPEQVTQLRHAFGIY